MHLTWYTEQRNPVFFLDYDRFGKDSDVSLMYIRNIRELVLECYLLINFKSISL